MIYYDHNHDHDDDGDDDDHDDDGDDDDDDHDPFLKPTGQPTAIASQDQLGSRIPQIITGAIRMGLSSAQTTNCSFNYPEN